MINSTERIRLVRFLRLRWRKLTGSPGSLRSQFVHGTIGSGGIRLAQFILQFMLAITLARVLGAEGYGVYAYAVSVAMLLTVPAQFGLPQLLVREVAADRSTSQWGRIRGLLVRAIQTVLVLNILIMVVFYFAGPALSKQIETLEWPVFRLALALIPIAAAITLFSSVLRGLHRVVLAQMPEMVFNPLLLLLFLTGTVFISQSVRPDQAIALNIAATVFVAIAGAAILWKTVPEDVRRALPVYETKRWLSSAFPFCLLAGISFLNKQADMLMLGFFVKPSDVGIYRVSAQGALIVSFSLLTVNMVLAPNVAMLRTIGDIQRLQKLITISARVAFLIALPIACCLIIFSRPVLTVFFGTEYGEGALALIILCVGQLFHVGMGSVGLILNMTGHEQDTVIGMAMAVFCNVGLNLLLVPWLGIEGAAIATLVSLLVCNLYLSAVVYRRTGLVSVALLFLRKSNNRHN